MTALSSTAYTVFARTRMAEARDTITRHVVCAYTGVCLGCGRPGPCAELTEARRTLAGHLRRVGNQRGAGTWYGHRQLPMLTGDVRAGLPIDELRAACLAVRSAVSRAAPRLAGTAHPLPRAGLARWDEALTDAWQALSLVYSGLSEARRLPGTVPASVGEVVDALRAARADADRAMVTAARVRRRLAAAEDRLRRTSVDPPATLAADRWRAAIARLDLVAARLAVGARALDRYADTLAGTTTPRPRPAAPGAAHPTSAATASTTATNSSVASAVRAGAEAAGTALLSVYPYTGWRGCLARLRRELRLDRTRRRAC